MTTRLAAHDRGGGIIESTVTNEEFRAWQEEMGWTDIEAAKQLGVTPRTIALYKTTTRPDGKPVNIPDTVWLACQALKAGIRLPGAEDSPVLDHLRRLDNPALKVGLELRQLAAHPKKIKAVEFDGRYFFAISTSGRRVQIRNDILETIWSRLSSRQGT